MLLIKLKTGNYIKVNQDPLFLDQEFLEKSETIYLIEKIFHIETKYVLSETESINSNELIEKPLVFIGPCNCNHEEKFHNRIGCGIDGCNCIAYTIGIDRR